MPLHENRIVDHLCNYCNVRNSFFSLHPELRFHPTSLKQQILLNLGYQVYDNPRIRAALFWLPENIQNNVYKVVKEMNDWLKENEQPAVCTETQRNSVRKLFYCFLRHMCWKPGSVEIDKAATAKIILQFLTNFDPELLYRPKLCAFSIAATHLLEEDIILQHWNFFDQDVHNQIIQFRYNDINHPIVQYWRHTRINRRHTCINTIVSIGGRPFLPITNWVDIITYCIKRHKLEHFEYFWPKAIQASVSGDNSLTSLCDHSFHLSIENENFASLEFIWNNTPDTYRNAMISSQNNCCTEEELFQPYRGFYFTINHRLYDFVEFLWKNATDKQRSDILFSNQFSPLYFTGTDTYYRIAKLLWPYSNRNERLIFLSKGNFAVFRDRCVNGDLRGVELFWDFADDTLRQSMFDEAKRSTFLIVYVNGSIEILRYLFDNMESFMKEDLVDHFFSRGLMLTIANRRQSVLEFFKLYRTTLQYKQFLCDNDFVILKLLLVNVCFDEIDGNDVTETQPVVLSPDLSTTKNNHFWYNEAMFLFFSLFSAEEVELLLPKLPKSLRASQKLNWLLYIKDKKPDASSAEKSV